MAKMYAGSDAAMTMGLIMAAHMVRYALLPMLLQTVSAQGPLCRGYRWVVVPATKLKCITPVILEADLKLSG